MRRCSFTFSSDYGNPPQTALRQSQSGMALTFLFAVSLASLIGSVAWFG
jgi:hypothetical protein